MELIEYRSLKLNILNSINWEREVLMDQAGGTTYECTRIRGNVIVTYNPGAISYSFRNGRPSQAPLPRPGSMPEETDREIRRFLEQPRGKLIVWSAGVRWLVSPSADMVCDVRNGPFLKVNTIAKIPGERLWQISLEIETYINEFPNQTGGTNQPLIISNRWYANDDVNWQQLRTRTYQGTCTVRGDVLQAQINNMNYIDSFRSSFCAFTVPRGFQRDQVKVTVSPDGNTAHYTVVDSEKPFNQTANSPAVRIDVADSSYMWRGSVGNMLSDVGGVFGVAVDAATDFRGTARRIITSSTKQLPKSYRTIVVQCWGNQRTNRLQLVNYAISIISTRIGNNLSMFDATTNETYISQDSQNYVNVKYTLSIGMDAIAAIFGGATGYFGTIANAMGLQAGATNAQRAFVAGIAADPDTIAAGVALKASPQLPNVAFPSDSGTRGTASLAPSNIALQTLLTQTLEGFDESPSQVP